MLSIQKVKSFFVHLLWSETKMAILDGPITLVRFIYWVSLNKKGVAFIYSF